MSDTQFFDTLLGDHMTETTYTIINPFSQGSPIMENVPEDKLQDMLRYFAWMIGIKKESLIVKEIRVSA